MFACTKATHCRRLICHSLKNVKNGGGRGCDQMRDDLYAYKVGTEIGGTIANLSFPCWRGVTNFFLFQQPAFAAAIFVIIILSVKVALIRDTCQTDLIEEDLRFVLLY